MGEKCFKKLTILVLIDNPNEKGKVCIINYVKGTLTEDKPD